MGNGTYDPNTENEETRYISLKSTFQLSISSVVVYPKNYAKIINWIMKKERIATKAKVKLRMSLTLIFCQNYFKLNATISSKNVS